MYQVRAARASEQLLRAAESGTARESPMMDRHFRCPAIKVLPGEYCVSSRDILLVTTLGSCVAACLRDPLAGIGGINHFLLPEGAADPASATARYGGYAMEMLINELIKRGATRARLEAKLFGAASVNPQLAAASVGQRNAAFARDYLANEGIALLADDLLGHDPRKVHYWPQSGRVMVQSLPFVDRVGLRKAEDHYQQHLAAEPVAGAVELF